MKNEAKIILALACTSSSIDQQTNAVSIFNLLEEMQFGLTVTDQKVDSLQEIAIPFQFDVFALFSRTDSSKTDNELPLEAKISFVDPSGKVLIDNPFPVIIEKGKKRFRMTVKFQGIKLTKTGTYLFKVSLLKEKGKEDTFQIFEVPVDIAVNVSNSPEIKNPN